MRVTNFLSLAAWLLVAASVDAQLAVTVSPPKLTESKVVVKLQMKNGFTEKVESARAALFLLDEQGKMVGQTTKWFIGGSRDMPGLAPGATNSFYFVITADRPLATTNLTPKLSVNRVVLENGKLANVAKDVIVTSIAK